MMRFFTSDLRRNIIKIVCLTLGLAIGFLLVAKVYFEETYDTFFPDSERIYRLAECFDMNGEYREYSRIAGAIAPAVKRYAPMVESATRYCYIYYDYPSLQAENGKVYKEKQVILADSCFFDVLPTEIIAGNPKEALSVQFSLMIPESLANKMGDDVLGQSLCLPNWDPNKKFIINGIYKDYPLNSSIPNAIMVSMPTIGHIMFDGRENWMGNDLYTGLVKLSPDIDPKDLQPYVTRMLEENIDKETLDMTNYNIRAVPLIGYHTSMSSVKTMNWIMALLAVVMLMCAGLNFLLITIGQTGKRCKEMAIRKCYGTSNLKIFGRVMCESLFYLILSLGFAILLAFCFSGICQQLLGYTPMQLLTTGSVWVVEGTVCIALLIITGMIPAWIYCRTPVAHSFSVKLRNRKGWKMILLSVQFFAASLLICVLALVGRQFSHVSSIDMGIEYENIGIFYLSNIPQSSRTTLVNELKKLSCVEGVSSADQDFINYAAGNNIWVNEDVEKEVNIADLYYANRDIIDVMGMKLLEGSTFSEVMDSTSHEVIVEEKFYDALKKAGADVVKGNMVGTTFSISEHFYEGPGGNGNEYTICGVVANMKRGGFEKDNCDARAAVMFPATSVRDLLYIRFNQLTPENLQEAQKVFNRVVPTKDAYIMPYKEHVMNLAEPVKQFGIAVIVIGIAILTIALIGLVGYTADEVEFRAKEVAIRKVSGYSAQQIAKLFISDILKIALPATLLGGIVAIPIGRRWLSQFTEQASLSPMVNILLVVLLILLIITVVAINTMSIARDNPVKHLHQD